MIIDRKAACRAYTMVELVLVVMVIGILATVAAPRYFDSLATSRVDSAAKRIAADLTMIRAHAMMKSAATPEEVRFYPTMEKYQLVNTADPDHPEQTYWVEFDKTAYPVDLVSSNFTNDVGNTSTMTIKFDMYGRAWAGASPVAPLVNGKIIVRSGEQQRTVNIDPVTGIPSVQ